MTVAIQHADLGTFNHRIRPDPGTMHATHEEFVSGMRRFAGAVNVITTRFEGVSYGLTATAVCSLSARPPRLLACVNTDGITFKAILDSGGFAVNTLTVGQEAVAMRFAGMKDPEEDRFSTGTWEDSQNLGVPLLQGACCSFECSICEVIDSSSHAMLIADIVGITHSHEGAPLVYHDGTFCGLLQI